MPPESRGRFEITPVLTVLAAGTLATVLQWTNGQYNPEAIPYVGAAWLVTLVAVLCRPWLPSRWLDDRALLAVLGLVLVAELGQMVNSPPTIEMAPNPSRLYWFNFMLALVGVVAGIGLAGPWPLRHSALARKTSWAPGLVESSWFPLLVALHFIMGRMVISFVTSPHIDVWTIEMEAVNGFLHKSNPYSMTFADPYGGYSQFFPPGASVNGRLMFGFVYPPLSFLLCVPGYVLGGDTRFSTLVAMELAAVFMAYARPGKIAKLAAAAFLFMPRTFFVMDRAWTDPFVVLTTAAVCYFAFNVPRAVFIPIGAYLCLKQHMFIGIPALFMVLPRPIPWRSTAVAALKVAAVAAIITLPFVLWDPKSFARSVLDIREVFRTDSLGLIAHLANTGRATLSKWTGLLAIVPVLVVGAWRAPRTPAGFALLAGAVHYTVYFFSTHAFCNEYYNVVGALFCSVAVWGDYDGKALFVRARVPQTFASKAAPA